MRAERLLLVCLIAAYGCDPGPALVDASAPDASADAGAPPPPGTERFCEGRDWQASRTDAIVGDLTGTYVGALSGPRAGESFAPNTLEFVKVIPEHPFLLETIRVAFTGPAGRARLRVVETFGRSYPANFFEFDGDEAGPWDLVPPVEIDVPADADPDDWIELDVSAAGVTLLPTQHYAIVYQHLEAGPALAFEAVPDGERSRSGLLLPTQPDLFGVDGSYRLALGGSYVCAWSDPERLFERSPTRELDTVRSPNLQVVDLNGDGHQDIVVRDTEGPRVLLGDGTGGFARPPSPLLGAARNATMLVFADLDGDGDQDAFAASYVNPDRDRDGVSMTEGDCNDLEASIGPGATEVPGNGRDDDCDGTTDDGASTADADGDGASIAAGDCDDTLAEVAPGASELKDGLDNDCDLSVDEDFVHRILQNDGTGLLEPLDGAGVEEGSATAAAAFADADGDGDLDLYYGNWLIAYPMRGAFQDRFMRGNGDGTFSDATEAAGMLLAEARPAYGATWNDWDGDGDQDLLTSNYQLSANELFRNEGDGTFVDVGESAGFAFDTIAGGAAVYPGGHSYGGDFGDIDNDGDMDYYMCNLAHPRERPWSDPSLLLINEGAPDHHAVDRREQLGLIYDEGDVNAAFGDYDNDGDLDLVVATLYANHYSRLYRNDGADGFVDVTYETGTAVHDAVSAVWVDLDEDGDLDLVIGDRGGEPGINVFLSRAAEGRHWIELDLEGTTTNRDALGARVTLSAGGVTRIRDVRASGGHANNQHPRTVHFGLGDSDTIESLTVRWVGGATESIVGAMADRRLRVVEGSGRVE